MTNDTKNPIFSKSDEDPLEISNEEWKKILPSDVYHITREKRTERPGTGRLK